MKKISLFLGVLLIACGAQAQREVLPDGGFEEWKTGTTHAGDSYDELANPFWCTLNTLSTLPPEMGIGPVTVFKEAKGRHGFAPKMVSSSMTMGEQKIFLPGVVGAFTVIINKMTALFGRPYTSCPKALKGYMKYTPANGDSASIFVKLYKKGKTIASVEQIFKGTVSDWTEFNLPLKYRAEDTPDSASVLFVSSAGYNFDALLACKGQVGSTLLVDDCEFVFDLIANENLNNKIKVSVYPNPATEYVNVILPNDIRESNMDIFDQSGRKVLSQILNQTTTRIELGNLSTGFYTYRIVSNAGENLASGKIIKK
ncbi:MAG: PCMD domain-containing protein [Bacteroidales bacterium]